MYGNTEHFDLASYLYNLRASMGGIWAIRCNDGAWRVERNLPDTGGETVEIYDSYSEMTQRYSVIGILDLGKMNEKWILRTA